jgi:acyl carrier protein
VPTPNITQAEIDTLKESLRRCSSETIDAAIIYRTSKDVALVPVIVTGIIERFLEPDIKPMISSGDDSLLLFDDLGVDSLTMMEIVILVEETLDISIENEELRGLQSISDIKKFITSKLGGGEESDNIDTALYPIDSKAIEEVMPQQQPFLFIDHANVTSKGAKGTYLITGKEEFLKGHFKNNPVFPASISIEALGQLGVLFLLKAEPSELGGEPNADSIYFTSCDGVRCHRMSKPGDVLEMEVKLKRLRHPMVTFEGYIAVDGEKVVYAEEITLLFDYVKKS